MRRWLRAAWRWLRDGSPDVSTAWLLNERRESYKNLYHGPSIDWDSFSKRFKE